MYLWSGMMLWDSSVYLGWVFLRIWWTVLTATFLFLLSCNLSKTSCFGGGCWGCFGFYNSGTCEHVKYLLFFNLLFIHNFTHLKNKAVQISMCKLTGNRTFGRLLILRVRFFTAGAAVFLSCSCNRIWPHRSLSSETASYSKTFRGPKNTNSLGVRTTCFTGYLYGSFCRFLLILWMTGDSFAVSCCWCHLCRCLGYKMYIEKRVC